MSTASAVPATRGELEGDEALETLRRTGRLRLLIDALQRFRAADGFSHSRALAFQLVLALVPALIALIGLATATGQGTLRRVLAEAARDLSPAENGGFLGDALEHGSATSGAALALASGLAAALFAGTVAMAQVERGANRIYGIEHDRVPVRRYGLGLLLAVTAGALTLAALGVLVAGDALRRALDLPAALEPVWFVLRWPVGLALATVALALLFEVVPHRRQPEASWLAVGAALSLALWLIFTGALELFLDVTDSFGRTYGPLAGVMGVLVWAFLTSIALFLGLAFAAQLEAVRAGAPGPRDDRLRDGGGGQA